MSDPINEILEFAEDSTNVLTPEEYSADAGRLAGHVPGRSRSNLENTALRQVSRFCRGVAEFIAEHYAPGVVDDGDAAKIVDGMEAAIVDLVLANAPTPGAATETVAGIAQIATTEEVEAGTDDATIITPAKLAAVLAANSSGTSFGTALILSRIGR